jgi:hypothetical protein
MLYIFILCKKNLNICIKKNTNRYTFVKNTIKCNKKMKINKNVKACEIKVSKLN